MVFLVQAAVVFVFPAGAIWAWRSGGWIRLWQYAALMLVNLVLIAMALASPAFGNRLAASAGYWTTLRGTVALGAFTEALPVIVAALTVQSTGRRLANYNLVYGLSVLGAILSFAVGVIAATYVLRPVR